MRSALRERGDELRASGFHGSDMNRDAFSWHVVTHALRYCFNSVRPSAPLSLPEGAKGWYWGSEEILDEFALSITGYNLDGWLISFMDYGCNGDKIQNTFFGNTGMIRLFAEIAAGRSAVNGTSDEFLVAEMVKQNIIHRDKNGLLTVNAPVYTKEQFALALEIMKPCILSVIEDYKAALGEAEALMEDHLPTHLKSAIPGIAYLEVRQKLMSESVRILWKRGFLRQLAPNDVMATTYTKLP